MRSLFLVNIRCFFRGILFLCFFLVCACGQPIVSPPTVKEKDTSFFKYRRDKDPDRKEILEQSQQVYSGGKLCSSDSSCVEICDRIFSLDFDEEDCKQLSAPQVYRFEKIYNSILEKELVFLQEIDFFDLRVFLNVSPEPFLKILRTLGPVSTKVFLNWIASDWRVAEIFNKEDWDFLFLEIFLNEIQLSPIDSLKEEVVEGRTFIELAWLKQNDPALFWLDDYFKKVQCSNFAGEKAENCKLAQYCLLSESFKSDVLREIVGFKTLKQILDKKQDRPYTDLKSFCVSFCSSEKGQNYCE